MSVFRPTAVLRAAALLALGSVLLTEKVLAGDDLPESTSLSNAFRQGWFQIGLTSGRIVLSGSRGVNYSTESTSSLGEERLSVRMSGSDPVVNYELSASEYELSVDFTSANRVLIRRTPKENSKAIALEFRQPSEGPVMLRIGRNGQEKVYQAASLWHLFVLEPAVCQKQLVPLLKGLQRSWDLGKTATEIEGMLLQTASHDPTPDQQRWAAWVRQLADERFSVREAADRQLRDTGRSVVTFLQHLAANQLDAEQQYRVRRIILSFSSTEGDDAPEQVSAWLSGDPAVWLAMLSRDEERTRKLAARQLEGLVGGPLAFDPDADPMVRAMQIEQLRNKMSAK